VTGYGEPAWGMAWPENHLDPGMWRVGSCSTCCEGMARTEDRRGWVEVGLSDMRLARAATNRHHDHVGLLPRLGSRANRDKSVRIAGTVLGYKSMSAPSILRRQSATRSGKRHGRQGGMNESLELQYQVFNWLLAAGKRLRSDAVDVGSLHSS
jgi:hypothetical protein